MARLGVVVLGDFNEDAEAPLGRVLRHGAAFTLRDVWHAVSPQARWPGTYGGFKGLRTRSRIDWILVGGALEVRACGKIEEPLGGGWPSDHYPVWALLRPSGGGHRN